MVHSKHIILFFFLFIIGVGCDVNSSKFPVNTDKLRSPENSGGFLRIINAEGATFHLSDLGNQQFVITLEEDDAKNGDQLKSVEFFVGFQDNSTENIGDIEISTTPMRIIQASEFSKNSETQLLRTTSVFTAVELLSSLEIEETQIGVNDAILLRWTLNLNNGNSYNYENSGSGITTGIFYNSPFAYDINIIQ